MGFVTCTLFLRTRLHPTDLVNGNLYLSCLFFGLVHIMFNGRSELPLLIFRLPVFYKQRDNFFYPAWAWSFSSWILQLPYSIIEAVVWSCVVYWTVGFAPGAGRYIQCSVDITHTYFIGYILLTPPSCFLQIFPLHVFTIFSTPNGDVSLSVNSFYFTRYNYCKYIWISCSANHIFTGWFYLAKR